MMDHVDGDAYFCRIISAAWLKNEWIRNATGLRKSTVRLLEAK
jgi:hypothetical protein